MEAWIGILFGVLVVMVVVGFYLGVPTRFWKKRRGRDLSPDGRFGDERLTGRRRRDVEQH